MSEENQEQEEQKPTLKDDVASVAGDLIKNRVARVARGAGKAGAQSVGSASVSAGTSAVSSAASSGAASAATSGAASAGSSAIAGAGGAAGIAGAAVGEVKNLGESIKEGDATGVVDSGVRVAGIGAATYFGGTAGAAAASAVLDTEIGKKTTRGISGIIVGAVVLAFCMLTLIIGVMSYSSISILTAVILPGNGMTFGGGSAAGKYTSCTPQACKLDLTGVDPKYIIPGRGETSFKDAGIWDQGEHAVDRAMSYVGHAERACDDGYCYQLCDYLAGFIRGYTNSGYNTAYDHWKVMVEQGLAHPGDRNVPIGATVFWYAGEGAAGHIATYVGDGMVVGNISGGPGGPNVYLHQADAPEYWDGYTYLGWSEPVFRGARNAPDHGFV